MSIYIDAPTWPGHGRLWSHLVSDVSYDELQAFADGLAIPRRAFHRDHYDVVAERYDSAVAAGALPVTSRDIVQRLTASGLRRRKVSRLNHAYGLESPEGTKRDSRSRANGTLGAAGPRWVPFGEHADEGST